MGWKTGYTKAARNVVLGKHLIGCDPYAQTFGEDLGLLDASLRHEDDELIASVAGHHVRLPAFLFEQSPYASEDKIAFKVSQRVVHIFKFVEVDQNDRERTAGAGRALPFPSERLPEESASLDAGKAIGD